MVESKRMSIVPIRIDDLGEGLPVALPDRRGKDGTGQSVTHRQRVRRRDGFMCVGWDIKSEIRKQTKADDRISVPY